VSGVSVNFAVGDDVAMVGTDKNVPESFADAFARKVERFTIHAW
jgi:hypothetical protein